MSAEPTEDNDAAAAQPALPPKAKAGGIPPTGPPPPPGPKATSPVTTASNGSWEKVGQGPATAPTVAMDPQAFMAAMQQAMNTVLTQHVAQQQQPQLQAYSHLAPPAAVDPGMGAPGLQHGGLLGATQFAAGRHGGGGGDGADHAYPPLGPTPPPQAPGAGGQPPQGGPHAGHGETTVSAPLSLTQPPKWPGGLSYREWRALLRLWLQTTRLRAEEHGTALALSLPSGPSATTG